MSETVGLSALALLHRALELCVPLKIISAGQSIRIKVVLRESESHISAGDGR